MKRHVLAVAHSAECYGADRCLHAALPELLERADVTVAVPHDGPGIAVIEGLGARVVHLGDYALRRRHLTRSEVVPWLGRVRGAVRELEALHRAHPIGVVWSNTLAASIGPLVARRVRAPHALHVHECPDEPRWLAPVLLAGARADVVICNSLYTAAWVGRRRRALRDRTVVVHNGIDLPPAPAAPPAPPDDGHLRIACVARIHPKKGHAVLFDALRRAAAAGRVWQVDLFGDTLPEHQPLEAALRSMLADAGLEDAVRWHGFVGDLQTQYRDADVAVVPSVLAEEFSLVCLEAQSLMVPVVATGPGGASEVVADGETGLIVAPGDADALYGALASLHDDADRRSAMGKAGRARAEGSFSRDVYAGAIRDVLLGLMTASTTAKPS